MLRWRIATLAVIVFLLLLEAYALWAGGTQRVAIAGLLAIAAVGVILQLSLARTGIVVTCGAAFFVPLYGVGGHLRPGDLLILFGLVLLVASQGRARWPGLTWWAWLLAGTIVLVAALHQFLPTDPAYLVSRTVLDAAGRPSVEPQTNLSVAGRFLISVIAIPLAFVLATQRDRRAPLWLAVSYTAGASLSGLTAFASALGLRSFTSSLGAEVVGSRQAGLAGHPNFLGATGVLAVAFPLWLLISPDTRRRRLGIVLLPGILLGTYESGSRGGSLGLLVSVTACMLIMPAYHRWLPTIAAVIAGGSTIAFFVLPGVGAAVLKATRLGGAPQTGSDTVRVSVARQGLDDFVFSPLNGVGMQVAAEAHNVYIQTLAAGGVLLFGAFIVYTLASIYTSSRLRKFDNLSLPLTASLVGGLPFGALENTLTYRFIYVPVSIVIALAYQHRVDIDGHRVDTEKADAALIGADDLAGARSPHQIA